jgi:hypothetical protein
MQAIADTAVNLRAHNLCAFPIHVCTGTDCFWFWLLLDVSRGWAVPAVPGSCLTPAG